MSHLHIGEFEISHETEDKQATLPCSLPTKSKLMLRLFDKYGVNFKKEEFQLKKGNNEIKLDCSNFEGGAYSAWIELEGKTFLRGFAIKEEQKKKNLLG